MRILIVGGVAAGASAATKARRINEDAEIIIFEKGPYVSFANCGLPYYVGGDVAKKDDLLLVTPKLFQTRFRIEVRTEHEVLAISPEKKSILVRHNCETTEESYDKLILATGCEPVLPPISGIKLKGVHTVASIGDVEAITALLDGGINSAVVVGGGFVGIETAEALLKRGIKTTLVEQQMQVLSNLDKEFSTPVERQLKRMGLKLMLGKSVQAICGSETAEAVELSTGAKVDAELVILSVGMRPRTELAAEAGIALGADHGIIVNDKMETSIPDIYAAGDSVEGPDLVTGRRRRNPLAGSANKQGRVAGANAAGAELRYKGALGTNIVRAGEITAGGTGVIEKEAAALGLDYYVSYTASRNHASFYPDAKHMIIKLIVEKNTARLLGAEVIGRDGADKRLDVLATAIYGRMTTYDLEDLDLAYSPPYSAARDPVLMAGMVSSNIMREIVHPITSAALRDVLKDENYQIVDVRRADEFLCGAVRGAVNIPVDEIRTRYTELDKNKKIVLYCGEGYRSYVAGCFLARKGFHILNLSGGYNTYIMDV